MIAAPAATENPTTIIWIVVHSASICKGLLMYSSILLQKSFTFWKDSSLLKTKWKFFTYSVNISVSFFLISSSPIATVPSWIISSMICSEPAQPLSILIFFKAIPLWIPLLTTSETESFLAIWWTLSTTILRTSSPRRTLSHSPNWVTNSNLIPWSDIVMELSFISSSITNRSIFSPIDNFLILTFCLFFANGKLKSKRQRSKTISKRFFPVNDNLRKLLSPLAFVSSTLLIRGLYGYLKPILRS